MIEIRITKEIKEYETKVIGPFNKRQLFCLMLFAPMGIFLFLTLRKYVSIDVAGLFLIFPAFLIWLFGWHKFYGMKTEEFLSSVFINMFIAPTRRPYKTENRHEKLMEMLNDEYKAMEEATQPKQKGQKGQKKKRYKRSKLAIK